MPSDPWPHPARRYRPLCEPLEGRLLCRITFNGDFIITPPGGGQGHATIHQHPVAGLTGLRTANAQTNGVVFWQATSANPT